MLEKDKFLKRFDLTNSIFNEIDLAWDDLVSIYDDYVSKIDAMKPTANYLAERLRTIPEVHSLKIRLKDPEHLIEKIIRKKREGKSKQFTIDNYSTMVTDLIGLRALHLFKEDWMLIHKYITENWKLHENPTANVRKGDSTEYIETFKNENCDVKEHPYGYRSVHYLVESQPAKELHVAEIQVRTIFEEAWSEIDHRIRYPYDKDNPILGQYLGMFNRLAGSADEMGSFVKYLKIELDNKSEQYEKAIQDKDTISAELKKKIGELEIKQEEKDELERQVNKLSLSQTISISSDLPILSGKLFTDGSSVIAGSVLPSKSDLFTGIQSGFQINEDGSYSVPIVTNQFNKFLTPTSDIETISKITNPDETDEDEK